MASTSSSLHNVVSSLVRAQMGPSIPASTLDEDLDKRVAELILREARKKEEKFNRTGSYSPQIGGNAARPNKRFLSSIIKSTDEHNKAILKAQADAANEIKQQLQEDERRERRRRAEDAVAARIGWADSPWDPKDDEIYRRRRRSTSRDRSHRHSRSSRRDRKRDRSRNSGVSDEESHRKRTSRRDHSPRVRSSSPKRRHEGRDYDRDSEGHHSHRTRRKEVEKEEERHRRKRRKRSRTRSRSPKRTDYRKPHRRRSKSPKATEEHKREDKYTSRRRVGVESQTRSANGQESPRGSLETGSERRRTKREERDDREEDTSNGVSSRRKSSKLEEAHDSDVMSESDSDIGPYPADHEKTLREYSSKMDKYFTSDYDPRLDLPAVSDDGFIPPAALDSWDWMLQIVKARREEKEERKRLEKLYKNDPSKGKTSATPTLTSASVQELMSMQYTKRGGVREWDEGKEAN